MPHAAGPAAPLAEIWRGAFLESIHMGHAVVCDAGGEIVEAWGDPNAVILPRSSAKMIQALPLIESGAATAHDLKPMHLALACASHNAARIHIDPVAAWLEAIGRNDDDFCCGPQMPRDNDVHDALIRDGAPICRIHNNCSGKHAGFLTLSKHLGAGPDYVDPDHPVQRACLEAFERMTGETSPGHGIDGCSAPNFASTLHGMARAMAKFAAAGEGSAAHNLTRAMATYPELVAGEGRACTRLMRAMNHKVAIKTGAEGFFIAILPEQRLGIALKVADGATRAAECAIAQLLIRHGALDRFHPEAIAYTNGPIQNWDGKTTGHMRAAPDLL
ncbi:asparaginase [Tateyamaria sp. SN6-1]|uniref:asparaginase n=1 Tax=Tateyamaria sp. SN6-1 TaxID=3092148 RepID=UPI0039F5BB8B